MPLLAENPLSILTFIVAPAILTNASSVMSLGTSNRFARAIDRSRELATFLHGKEPNEDPETILRVRQLKTAEDRMLLLVRALTAFYVAVGAFSCATLVSLLGALFYFAQQDGFGMAALAVALLAGATGVGSLMIGSGLVVKDTTMAFRILRDETDHILQNVISRHAPKP